MQIIAFLLSLQFKEVIRRGEERLFEKGACLIFWLRRWALFRERAFESPKRSRPYRWACSHGVFRKNICLIEKDSFVKKFAISVK